MRPLKRTHPELEIRDNLPLSIEYRVYNYKLSKDGTNVSKRGTTWTLFDVLAILAAMTYTWYKFHSSLWVVLVGVLLLWHKAVRLAWESVVVVPSLGIQIEKCKGFSLPFTSRIWPFSASRHFIPIDCLHDILINESLYRWDWYYYLAILQRDPPKPLHDDMPHNLSIQVAFEDILPPLPVVREIYHGVREVLFQEFKEDEK
ncbi:hypothetical protein CPB86DRAFT_748832 [Serendipita vermifera]|nr:hypothetical protein CPB86DRAFT_748832 [Serendipita vermifera]